MGFCHTTPRGTSASRDNSTGGDRQRFTLPLAYGFARGGPIPPPTPSLWQSPAGSRHPPTRTPNVTGAGRTVDGSLGEFVAAGGCAGRFARGAGGEASHDRTAPHPRVVGTGPTGFAPVRGDRVNVLPVVQPLHAGRRRVRRRCCGGGWYPADVPGRRSRDGTPRLAGPPHARPVALTITATKTDSGCGEPRLNVADSPSRVRAC